jgi:hypothetical protein
LGTNKTKRELDKHIQMIAFIYFTVGKTETKSSLNHLLGNKTKKSIPHQRLSRRIESKENKY